jgi:hypothetical protein
LSRYIKIIFAPGENIMIDVNVYDNVIPEDFRKEVWEYINNQKWYASWKRVSPSSTYYIPSEQTSLAQFDYRLVTQKLPTMWLHRTVFGSDDYTLERDHPTIWKLWCMINQHLGNLYTIAGPWEDMASTNEYNPNNDLRGTGAWAPPTPKDPSLEPGWRAYTNGQPDETLKRSHGIHKDTIDVDDDTTRTILYVANLEWYPSWFGEVIFYPDDDKGLTGDHQQFQKGVGQSRNFNIDWLDNGKIVSPVPGRIIDYDGRTLHTTRPTSIWSEGLRITIAFRARKKPK